SSDSFSGFDTSLWAGWDCAPTAELDCAPTTELNCAPTTEIETTCEYSSVPSDLAVDSFPNHSGKHLSFQIYVNILEKHLIHNGEYRWSPQQFTRMLERRI